MNFRNIATVALVLGLAGTATAGEPIELSDDALDSVVAGYVTGGLAVGYSKGSSTSGLFGSASTSVYGSIVRREEGTNEGATGTWWQGSAGSYSSVYSGGPGATSASVDTSGVYLKFF